MRAKSGHRTIDKESERKQVFSVFTMFWSGFFFCYTMKVFYFWLSFASIVI